MTKGFLFDEGDELITRKDGVSGSAAHLSSDPVELTIDGTTYNGYPLDKSYKDLLEYPSPIYVEEEPGTVVYYPNSFNDSADYYDGYTYEVTIKSGTNTLALAAETETGTLYFITSGV